MSDSTSTAELLVRSPCFCFARSVLPPRSVFGPDLLRAWQNLAAAAVSQADKMQAAHALIEKYDTDKVRAPPISSTRTIFRSAPARVGRTVRGQLRRGVPCIPRCLAAWGARACRGAGANLACGCRAERGAGLCGVAGDGERRSSGPTDATGRGQGVAGPRRRAVCAQVLGQDRPRGQVPAQRALSFPLSKRRSWSRRLTDVGCAQDVFAQLDADSDGFVSRVEMGGVTAFLTPADV